MDDAEFARLYAATSRQVWAFLRRSVDAAEADDLLQEAYFRFLRSGKRVESDEHAKNYLFRIAANLLRDLYRRRKVRANAPEPEDEPVEPERASLARNELKVAFADLGDRDRQLLWLAHAEGFSHREIAEILEIKEASVRPMLFRARQRAAAHLRNAADATTDAAATTSAEAPDLPDPSDGAARDRLPEE
jgi:RNA polymerase sigma-70 factor (ECF subfamily)